MKASDKGIAFLVAHEGIVPGPYWDSANPPVLTFGIGHTSAAGDPDPAKMPRGMPADLDAALRDVFRVFRTDLAKYEAEVRRALNGMKVQQHEFDAALAFHFDTGAIARASWVKSWRAGNRRAAEVEFMNWRSPASIIPRRKEERNLWATGQYGAKRAAVWPVSAAGKITWKAVRTLSQSEVIAMLRPDEVARPPGKPADGGWTAPAAPVPTSAQASAPKLGALLIAALAAALAAYVKSKG
ncbi:lysozyme [Paracoccus sphaerophysae]|uniref:lysozyme n=1 Tax=Paracoccus sphaerophysae TaxID=690417 RepID=UPI0012EB3131|nr:lysozyme [Paracoccus sphaerophysae]